MKKIQKKAGILLGIAILGLCVFGSQIVFAQLSCTLGEDCYCDLYPEDDLCSDQCTEGTDCLCDIYPDDPQCWVDCTPDENCYCDVYPEDDYLCNPCNPHGYAYEPDTSDCDPCEFYNLYWDDPYNAQCGPCNSESSNYDPEFCDPCDPFGPVYDPEFCNPCDDPDSPFYEEYCNPCNPYGIAYDETANCDPCDPSSDAYDEDDPFMQDPCNPWGCNYDSNNSDCGPAGDPCDPESDDYDPQACDGWRPIFTEPFDEADLPGGGWNLESNGDINWSITNQNNHDDWHLESLKSVGATSGAGYPANLENWIIYGPIDLSGMKAADINFSIFRETDEDDRVAFCMSDDSSNLIDGILENGEFYGSTGDWWEREYFDLSEFAGQSEVYIAWVFQSNKTGSDSNAGVFIDEIEIWATNEEVNEPQWEQMLIETFDDSPFTEENWTILPDADGTWEFENWYFSAWPFRGNSNTPETGGYPATPETWMIYGPIDLSDKTSANGGFSCLLDIPEGDDWLGFSVGTSADQTELYENAVWFTGSSEGEWIWESFDLEEYIGQNNVYIGWVFESENESTTNQGAFIDDIGIWATSDPIEDPFDEDAEGWWDPLSTESFDDADFSDTSKWTLSPADNGWVVTDQKHSDWNEDSSKSASAVTPGSGYSAGLNNWLFYGPVDLSEMMYADVNFSLYYDLVYSDDENWENDDLLCFGVATGPDPENPDNVIMVEACWGDSSWEAWEGAYADLTPYIEMGQIYLFWNLESNIGSDTKEGAFIDEINIWGQSEDAEIPEFDFEDDGLLIPEDDFYDWSIEDENNFSVTEIGGDMVAVMSGTQSLYQIIDVPPDAVDMFVSFSYAIASDETEPGDHFCVSFKEVKEDGTPAISILVDFGCWDALDFPEYARSGEFFEWFEESLSDEELDLLRGGKAAFTIELYQNDVLETGETTLFVDEVSVYVTGETEGNEGGHEFAEQLDKNEPNDARDKATPIGCGQPPLRGWFGDIGGDKEDVDFFVLKKVPEGRLTIDIDAQSLKPSSEADTVVELIDSDGNPIAENDDNEREGSFDSRLDYKNTTDGATYFIKVSNYDREGGPKHFYEIKVTCGQPDADADTEIIPEPEIVVPDTGKASWTVMIFGNGDNDLGTNSYHLSRQAIEKYIDDKKDFLNVVMLIDGHPNYSASDQVNTLRYVVQPDGTYEDNVSKWDRGELNMGDPQTLIDFAKWAMTNYPAEHYYLAVDDHGNGPDGISWDMTSGGDQLTPAELRRALKEITEGGQKKIDIFDFEACLMGLVENAYDLKEFVNYVAFFQSISWTSLNYPAYFINLDRDDDARTVAKRIIRNYPVASESEAPYTYSLIDTSKLTALREKIDAFATELGNADLTDIKAARDVSQAFFGDPEKGDATQDTRGYIDLWDLAHNIAAKGIASAQANELKAAIGEAVIETKAVPKGQSIYTFNKFWDYSNYHGLSILFPSVEYTFLDDYAQNYEMSKDGKWDEFLTEKVFGEDVQGVRPKNFSSIGLPRVAAPASSSSTDLGKAILALKVLAGMSPSGVNPDTDLNNNGKIDMGDVISILGKLSQ
ncbi:clostripain-related cysteine peptidase [Desulfobacterales bacterium HSG2]|nr:clostripain-related cysteine peptidase [Desulfobacterales bacterium HSG2]